MRFAARGVFVSILAVFLVNSAVSGAMPEGLVARGGLAVLVGGADDISPAVELAEGPWAVHWLEGATETVESARLALMEAGLHGRVAVEHWTSDSLPYADNLANLVVVLGGAPSPRRDEILRVLAPEGLAVFPGGDGRLERVVKERPPEMGEWTHPRHGPDGGLISDDRAFEPPNAFQWIAGPPFPLRSRKASAGSMFSAGGRVFQITNNVPENLPNGGTQYLVARDAFNGVVLWSQRWRGPLSRHVDGAHVAAVASGDRLYGARSDEIAVFDVATGEVLDTWETPGTADKLVLVDGLLIAQTPEGQSGFNVADGTRAWFREADAPWNTVAYGGRAFCLTSTREVDGRWRHELLAVDLRSGEEAWRRPLESIYGSRNTAVLRIHSARGGVVCLIERYIVRAVSAEDGSELWRRESDAEARGAGGRESRQVGHFYANGKLWFRGNRSRNEGPETWYGLDPKTGEEVDQVVAAGPQGVIGWSGSVSKQGCQPLTATVRYVLDARLATAWCLESGERHGWKFARGGCQIGMVPANGMGYVPPNACGCLAEQLTGNLAVVRTADAGLGGFTPAPLQRGPAYGDANLGDVQADGDWPTYRRDGQRSAFLPESLPANLGHAWRAEASSSPVDPAKEWELQFGRPLTPPTAAGGMVFLAEPQSHQVLALDGTTGEVVWRYAAAARVSVPPTIYNNLALFGAHDGYVYALRASDGILVWRRRAAPSDRRIMAYGQVESAWPVSGGVLIHDGLALAASGRAVDADGGLAVVAFEPKTGEIRWTSRVRGAIHGLNDPLVTDGEHVYLMNMRLDVQTGETTEIEFGRMRSLRPEAADERGRLRRIRYPEGVRYLRGGQRGLLETSWTRLDMGLRKDQSSWTWGESEGEVLAFDGHKGFAFQIDAGGNLWAGPRVRGGGGGWLEGRLAGSEEPAWQVNMEAPGQVEAMLLTPDALYVAGPRHRTDSGAGGFLRIVSRSSGEALAEMPLPAAPVHDGLAAADGRIFVVLRDRTVLALAAE